MRKNIIIMIVLCIYSELVAAEIYKWVDNQGNIHYGDKPNAGAKEMEVDVSKKGNIKINNTRENKRKRLLDAYANDQLREDKEAEKIKKKRAKKKKNCEQSKKRLGKYERSRSLYYTDKDGNKITLSNEERDKTTADLKMHIQKNCK